MAQLVRFPGSLDQQLVGAIELPAGPPRGWVLFAHCFTCSKDLKAVRWLTDGLARASLAVLRFDFTGLGESEGDFADTNFSTNLEDLLAAAAYLREHHTAPSLLVGHSLGGAAVIAVAPHLPECRAVATIAAPSDPGHLLSGVLEPAASSDAESTEVEIAGRRFQVKRQLIDDLREQRLLEIVGGLDRPLLLLHSPQDTIVGIDHAKKLFDAARQPKSLVALDGADHLLLDESAARYAAGLLAAWADRYLDPASPGPPDDVLEGWVRVRGASGLGQAIDSARHHWLSDEPRTVKGATDRGPTPYDLLLSALGACKAMTMRLYADRKGWPLRATTIDLRHGHVHAKDCADCEKEDRRLERIEARISLRGDLDPEQRQRLLEIAGRCPVHRTLTGELAIEERLTED